MKQSELGLTEREAVRVGAVIVDVGPDQHRALQRAKRKVRTYGKALLVLVSLLCLSVCGSLVSSALSLLVFKEFRGAIPHRSVELPDAKAAAPVGASLPTSVKDAPGAGAKLSAAETAQKKKLADQLKQLQKQIDIEQQTAVDKVDASIAPLQEQVLAGGGMKLRAQKNSPDASLWPCKRTGWVHLFKPGTEMQETIAPSGAAEACWELADPTMTVIPDRFLQGNTDLKGTLRVGPAVTTIGVWAFHDSGLTGLDLSEATSLVEIGDGAFYGTSLAVALVIPAKVSMIGNGAFQATKLTGLDLSKAISLVEIGDDAFSYATDLAGTLVLPANVTMIGSSAFQETKIMGLDLSKATSLVEIWDSAFLGIDSLEGTLVIPANVRSIADCAFQYTKLTSLDLSKATSLVEIGAWAFFETGLQGTLVVPSKIATIGDFAFESTKLTGLDLSKATSLVEVGEQAFYKTGLAGTLVVPATVRTIGDSAFYGTNLTGHIDLSKATSLVGTGPSLGNTGPSLGHGAFSDTDVGLPRAHSYISDRSR